MEPWYDTCDALVVVDMQNSFLLPGGAMYDVHGAPMIEIPRTIERTAEAVSIAQDRALPVIYTRHCYRPGWIDAGVKTLRLFETMSTKPLVNGTWDADVVEALAPSAASVIVDKTRMDAFIGTDLELVLRGFGARRLAMTGVVTNACVECTTRSASMRDIDVTILADCCTTFTAEHQQNALAALEFYRFAELSAVHANPVAA